MGTEIEFGTRAEANEARDLVGDEHLTGRYVRRYATIEVADDAPDDLVADLEARAAESRAEKEAGSGQADLTRAERNHFDLSRDGLNVPKLRSIKAVMADEGVSDWRAHVDPTLSVDEHRQVAEQAATEGGGARMDVETSDDQRRAELERQRRGADCDHALDHCVDGEKDACDFLVERCGFDQDKAEELVAASSSDEELTGEAYGALSKLWNQYKAGLAEAKDAAAGINGIRAEFGQEPLTFEELGDRTIEPTDINA
ncbi:MAG: hypothetical protein ACI8XM_000232 [Haloarculaceae archaeon]|jgi:hypothetical protein